MTPWGCSRLQLPVSQPMAGISLSHRTLSSSWTHSRFVPVPTTNWVFRRSSSLCLICPLIGEIGWGRVRSVQVKVEICTMWTESYLMECYSKETQGAFWGQCTGPTVGFARGGIRGENSNGPSKWPGVVPVSEGCCPWLGIYGTGQFNVIQRTKGSRDTSLKSIKMSRFQWEIDYDLITHDLAAILWQLFPLEANSVLQCKLTGRSNKYNRPERSWCG